MGNFNSCINPNLKTATLISPDGTTCQITLPITAADLMLNHPGYIISPAHLIRCSRPIPAIKAESQLSPGNLYLLFPAHRVRSKATLADTALVDRVGKSRGFGRGGSKVSPASVTEGLELTCHRAGGQWQPVLEPIFEEPRGSLKYLTRIVR